MAHLRFDGGGSPLIFLKGILCYLPVLRTGPSYFDPNEGKYYLAPQSVETAIAEEKARATKTHFCSEPVGTVPNNSGTAEPAVPNHAESQEISGLENEIRDLQITNKAKDMVIERMQKERDGVFEQLLASSRKVGELETKLLQLESPNADRN